MTDLRNHFPDQTPPLAIHSPIGWWLLSSTETHLLSVDWMEEVPATSLRTEPLTKLEQRLDCMLSRYFKGDPVDFSRIPVELSVSRFQNAVLNQLRKVTYGEVRSYQWLAVNSGNPKAVRAVGGALGRNPVPIVIPCHRIIASNGSLGGFMQGDPAGSRLKSYLLKLEGISLG